jgi:hypothetical protein
MLSLRGFLGIRRPPYIFTKHGVAMLSSVLNSSRAVQMSIMIVRAFVKLRELVAGNKDLASQIEQIEAVQKQYMDMCCIRGRACCFYVPRLRSPRHPEPQARISILASWFSAVCCQ